MSDENYGQRVSRRFGEKKPLLYASAVASLVVGPLTAGTVSETLGGLVTFFGSVVCMMTLREIFVGPVPPPAYRRNESDRF